MENIERFSQLIDLHFTDSQDVMKDRLWYIKKSNISGRGVFAKRDIKSGEIIFRESPLLIGPTGKKGSILNTCTICYQLLDEKECVCENGCSLPVCKNCNSSEQHLRECKLYKEWQPLESNTINGYSLRLLTIARGLFLNKNQKELLYAMQANNDPKYEEEVHNGVGCFSAFPIENIDMVNYFYRIVSVINTNGFEAHCQRKSHEIILRGLYPLSGTLNHECTPNTCHQFDENNKLIMKACKFIPEGTEITTTYVKLIWNTLHRRLFLNLTKRFTCKCIRCEDPTENGTFLSATLCRKNACFGLIVPNDNLQETWTCMKCDETYNLNYIQKIHEFSLNAINAKTSPDSSVKDLIKFINERIPKICPASNQLAIEAKLTAIWRMNSKLEDYTMQDYNDKIQYCNEILEILEKLGAGDCTLRKLLLEEIEKTKEKLKNN